MRNEPNAEEAARYIIRLFVEQFRGRPNDVLRPNNFINAFARDGWRGTDFAPGMHCAAENGWVEFLSGGASFRLTQKGYSKSHEVAMDDLFEACNEEISIEKPDGKRFENVRALITSGQAIVPDTSIPIEPGDAILRQLPSAIVERLIVRDPGFLAGMDDDIPAHYQIKYAREGWQEGGTPGYTFHMHGDNSRVNIHSTDNSTSTITHGVEELSTLVGQFVKLRDALVSKASDAEHYAAVGAVANAEIAAKAGDRSKMMGALKALGGAGKWAFNIAKDVGVDLAAKVITESMKGS